MSDNRSGEIDTFACKRKLALAMSNQDLDINDRDSVQYQNAMFCVSVALGKCRLYGIDPQELDGVLTTNMAATTASAANRMIGDYEKTLIHFATNFDELDDDAIISACQVLTDRMDLWAADIAITEAWELAIEEEASGYLELDCLVVQFSESLLRVDEKLAKCHALLYTAASTNILSNWRQLVAPKFQDIFPWWLDGSIESEMEQMKVFADRLIPADSGGERRGYDLSTTSTFLDSKSKVPSNDQKRIAGLKKTSTTWHNIEIPITSEAKDYFLTPRLTIADISTNQGVINFSIRSNPKIATNLKVIVSSFDRKIAKPVVSSLNFKVPKGQSSTTEVQVSLDIDGDIFHVADLYFER